MKNIKWTYISLTDHGYVGIYMGNDKAILDDDDKAILCDVDYLLSYDEDYYDYDDQEES